MVIRTLLLAVAVLMGVIVGLAASILARVGGKSLPVAIRDGGVAFGGTVTLTVVIMTALKLL